jgi:hypothetical protein
MNNRRKKLIQTALPQNAIRASLIVTSSRDKLLMIVRNWQSKSNRKIVTVNEKRTVNWKLLVATERWISPWTRLRARTLYARGRVPERASIYPLPVRERIAEETMRAWFYGRRRECIARESSRSILQRGGSLTSANARRDGSELHRASKILTDPLRACISRIPVGARTDAHASCWDSSRVPQNTMSIIRVAVRDALRDQVITDVKQLRCNDLSQRGLRWPLMIGNPCEWKSRTLSSNRPTYRRIAATVLSSSQYAQSVNCRRSRDVSRSPRTHPDAATLWDPIITAKAVT